MVKDYGSRSGQEKEEGKVMASIVASQAVEIGIGAKGHIGLRIECVEGGTLTAPRIEISGCTFGNCEGAPITMAIDGGEAVDIKGKMEVIDPAGEHESLRAKIRQRRTIPEISDETDLSIASRPESTALIFWRCKQLSTDHAPLREEIRGTIGWYGEDV